MEPFACANLCRRQGTNLLDPDEQAARCCALPGYDRRRWSPGSLAQIHMGAPPRYDLEGADPNEHPGAEHWDEPQEPIEEDGCPGSWYRTAWLESVLRYARRPAGGEGGRVPNRLLDLCDDELVVEAVERLEAEEDRWQGEHRRRMVERLQRQARQD